MKVNLIDWWLLELCQFWGWPTWSWFNLLIFIKDHCVYYFSENWYSCNVFVLLLVSGQFQLHKNEWVFPLFCFLEEICVELVLFLPRLFDRINQWNHLGLVFSFFWKVFRYWIKCLTLLDFYWSNILCLLWKVLADFFKHVQAWCWQCTKTD